MPMGLENPVHLIFIGIVALLVLGPRRLPELARALGHGLREFREAMSGETRPQIQAPPLQEPLQAQPAESAPAARAAAQPGDGATAPRESATSTPTTVDPTQTIRSPDATDRGPL
jgi:TatA/E family protein of Tat protein translocase